MRRFFVASSIPLIVALSACTAGELDGVSTDDTETAAIATPFKAASTDLRIAVIGAGPSGLTAAHTLRDLGYNNVTVFEKDATVGGKVNSLSVGPISAELGAVFASPDYRVVLDLVEEYGIQTAEYSSPRFVMDEQGNKYSFGAFLLSRYTAAEAMAAVQKYAAVLAQYGAVLEEDGFVAYPDDLKLPFRQFAQKYGFEPIAEMAKSLVVGFGYGYYEDMPAMYVMKLLPWLVKVGPTGLVQPPYYTFPTGWQSLWKAVAADLPDVRTFSKVTKIERGGCVNTACTSYKPVKVWVNYLFKYEFDAVIVALPLSVAKNIVKLTNAETALFNKVFTSRYFTTVFTAANVPGGEAVFIHDNARKERENHLLVYAGRDPSTPVYVGYQLTDWNISRLGVGAVLASDISQLTGGTFIAPLVQKEWDTYFPRIDVPTAQAGFYDDVEALQGQQGLFFTGGNLSFETVEHSARHGQGVVLANFPQL